MAAFILKPILWNTEGYLRPSGAGAHSGFPQQHGYGHEEWNNNPRLAYLEDGLAMRAFHTEGVGHAPVGENVGQTFVFMVASHDRVQQLVGVAGCATHLAGANSSLDNSGDLQSERERLFKLMGLDSLAEDAWRVPLVRERYQGDHSTFLKTWNQDKHWLPNWICPEPYFWWLPEPVSLDSMSITGRGKLLTMFGRYTLLDETVASRIMHSVPERGRDDRWIRIVDAMSIAPASTLSWSEVPEPKRTLTSRLALVQSRLGQGDFRAGVMAVWGGRCAVTDLSTPELLRASHIKPWIDSSAFDRLSPHNGLLLSANLDALFDRFLITFNDDGQMLVSNAVAAADRELLGLPRSLRQPPSENQKAYLAWHRCKFDDRANSLPRR